MTDEDELVKLHLDLPNHWLWKGESMWARPLGGGLYELENSPFCAYGLNYKDVVLARSDNPAVKPTILSVERRGGHRTLRFIFSKSLDGVERDRILGELNQLGATFEGHKNRMFSLDIPPDKNYQAICDELMTREREGLLEYETCEERVPGSFDDRPQSETE
jgi:hypothetical protein